MSDGATLAPGLALLTGVVAFAGIWLAVTSLLSTISGWPALAAAFPGGPIPEGTRWRGQVLGIGRVTENNATTLVACPGGLYLYAFFLFRFRHPPILVPWSQVRCREAKRFLWSRWYVLDLGGITTMRVRQGLGPVLQAHGVAVPSVEG